MRDFPNTSRIPAEPLISSDRSLPTPIRHYKTGILDLDFGSMSIVSLGKIDGD